MKRLDSFLGHRNNWYWCKKSNTG